MWEFVCFIFWEYLDILWSKLFYRLVDRSTSNDNILIHPSKTGLYTVYFTSWFDLNKDKKQTTLELSSKVVLSRWNWNVATFALKLSVSIYLTEGFFWLMLDEISSSGH